MPRRNLTIIFLVAVVSWICYQRASKNRFARTLAEAMNIVERHYVSEVEPRALFEGAMNGMVATLDPNSGYTSPDEFSQFQQQMEGEFVGIGIVVEQDEEHRRLNVTEAFIGKPAYMAGIRAGDSIVAIDEQETKDLVLRDAVKSIRGKEGTTVKLRILRPEREGPLEFALKRATIPLESVLGDARQDGKWVYRLADHPRLGYIRIFDGFGERTAAEFREALASYRQGGEQIDGLILDLRYNRGGLLESSRDICDMLLDQGTIVTTRGRNKIMLKRYEAKPGVELPLDVPMVVLVDRLSASASEIVAAALQDNGRAVVAGQRTWGKATVQNVILLEGRKSALRLTVGSYHRPSGKEIHKWKDAKEADDWGVQPSEGLEALLTNHENELVILARRKRDFIPWDQLVAKQSLAETKPAEPKPSEVKPTKTKPSEGSEASEAASLDAEATRSARIDPMTIDPQLRKAIGYLESKKSSETKAE